MLSPKFQQLVDTLDRIKRSDMPIGVHRTLTDPSIMQTMPRGHQGFVNEAVQLARDVGLDSRSNEMSFRKELLKSMGYEVVQQPYDGHAIHTTKGVIVF